METRIAPRQSRARSETTPFSVRGSEGEEVHNLRVVFWFAAVACAVAAVVGIVATRILREENARMGYQMTIV